MIGQIEGLCIRPLDCPDGTHLPPPHWKLTWPLKQYRGVRAVVGRGDECAGRVHKRHSGETWLEVPLSDCFSQVGGIWVNCMTDRSPGDMYIATGCDMSMRSPSVVASPKDKGQGGTDVWHVYARHTRQSDKVYMMHLFLMLRVAS